MADEQHLTLPRWTSTLSDILDFAPVIGAGNRETRAQLYENLDRKQHDGLRKLLDNAGAQSVTTEELRHLLIQRGDIVDYHKLALEEHFNAAVDVTQDAAFNVLLPGVGGVVAHATSQAAVKAASREFAEAAIKAGTRAAEDTSAHVVAESAVHSTVRTGEHAAVDEAAKSAAKEFSVKELEDLSIKAAERAPRKSLGRAVAKVTAGAAITGAGIATSVNMFNKQVQYARLQNHAAHTKDAGPAPTQYTGDDAQNINQSADVKPIQNNHDQQNVGLSIVVYGVGALVASYLIYRTVRRFA